MGDAVRPEEEDPARLHVAHVLFMDIVGYSRLPMEQQSAILADLQSLVRATAQFQKSQSAGELVSLPTGDGMALVFFGSPEDPVRCAIDVSRALGSRTSLPLRMGIHTGPVYRVADINANQNVAGGGINIAQRVMDCGDAGHILVSDASARMLMQMEAWKPHLADLGTVPVKHGVAVHLYNLTVEGAGQPVRPGRLIAASRAGRLRWLPYGAAAAAAIAAVTLWASRGGDSARVTSVVALPATVRGSTEYAFLTDAIPSTLSTQLAQVEGLETKMPPSSVEFLRINSDIARAARAYGVSACVLSTVSTERDQLMLNVQLVDADTRRLLWSDDYVGAKAGYLGVVQNAARGLRQAMQLREAAASATPADRTSEVELAFRRGQHHSHRLMASYSAADFDAAYESFTRVLELDPKAADAAAEIAMIYVSRIVYGVDPATADPAARKWAARAIELQPKNGLAWATLTWADVFGIGSIGDKTVEAGLRAATFAPRCADCQTALGSAVQTSAMLSQAADQEALRIDPLNTMALNNSGSTYGLAGRLDAALAAYDQALALEPGMIIPRMNKVVTLAYLGRLAEARRVLASLPGAELPPDRADVGMLTIRHAVSRLAGETVEADALLAEIQRRLPAATTGDLTWIQADMVASLAKGRPEAALDLLAATTERLGVTPGLEWLDAHPAIASLRGTPRFAAIRQRALDETSHLARVLEAARGRGQLPAYLEEPLRNLLKRASTP